jgi:nitrite reductase/ring-hydroxylating ferredoxin subunit
MPRRKPAPYQLLDRIEQAEALDPPAEKIAKFVRDTIPSGPVKDALSGTWLGHALHPVAMTVPMGTWLSAVLLDWFGGEDSEQAADRLISTGLLAFGPTAATGWSDYADTTVGSPRARRVGILHAAANIGAASLFIASRLARAGGDRGRGKALALGGVGALGAAGFLGGHLAYGQGVGVDTTVFDEYPSDWTRALDDAELGEGSPRRVLIGDLPVMLLRTGGRLYALADRCSHRGGPLSEGEIADGCVTCPWHGSRFRLEDGSVEGGPAAYPQPRLETRVSGGAIEVRSPQ